MYWTQSPNPPSSALWAASDLAYQIRIDSTLAAMTQEQNYLLAKQAAAVDFAETIMGCSLLTRTITAIFNQHDTLFLPRGPIQSITSVADANGTISSSNYSIKGYGNAEELYITTGFKAPLTVVYQAGYGNSAADIDPAITEAILSHVALLYESRESAGDRTRTPIPHSLEAFYRLKARQIPVG